MKILVPIICAAVFFTACGQAQDTLPDIGGRLRGFDQLMIRLPLESGQFQEDILVTYDPGAAPMAIRGPSNVRAPGVDIASYHRQLLALPLWNALDELRNSWCGANAKPSFAPPKTAERLYEVAVICPPQLRVIQIVIPEIQLSMPLMQLVQEIPSPKDAR